MTATITAVRPDGTAAAGAPGTSDDTFGDLADLRVALVHYWLVGMRGGERVVEEILSIFPRAEIFTHVADRDRLSPRILSHPIHETGIADLPGARRHYQRYLPFMPRALEEIDLSGFDLVVSSESGPAKGVIVPPATAHVCYCHSPMRYLYDQYPLYRSGLNAAMRPVFSRIAHRLRQWDYASASRVDTVVANSSFTAARVRRFWGREAQIVHPHANLDLYTTGPLRERRGFVAVSQLVRYKRLDLVVDAFRGRDEHLTVVGDGEERADLERDAPPNVSFAGRVDDEALRDLYRSSEALVFPGEEDFGIVPVEAMACGTPVLAFERGGIRDTVIDGRTGLFFREQSAASIRDALVRFRATPFDADAIAVHARQFSAANFRRRFARICRDAVASKEVELRRASAS